ncbi:MAG: ribbon-helix-helix protein, CopG family [Candidatus Hodarchaeota archaeon]
MADTTTIQIDKKTKKKLDAMKISSRDTYNDVIEQLIEDSLELSEETKKDIQKALEDYEKGRVSTLDEVKKELGL